MEVREIAHSQSGAENLTATVNALVSIVINAVNNNEKVICFVTGVPGSGKTLAGLRAVHDERLRQISGSEPAFFSGNGPLVKILREALIRDAVRRGEKKSDATRRITTMIHQPFIGRTFFGIVEARSSELMDVLPGTYTDPTVDPEPFNATADFLSQAGAHKLPVI